MRSLGIPLPDALAAGVNVSLGTDGTLNNNRHDMFGEMKAACLLQNAARRSASAQPHSTPVHNLVSNIVFTAGPTNVHSVLIGGRMVLRNHVVEGVDESAILA